MSDLLKGLRVAVAGDGRVVRVAASWLADLGATVWTRGAAAEEDERLWLGEHDPAPASLDADVLIAEHGADVDGLRAPVVVRYAGSGSAAPEPNQPLDGRALAGRGGVAVAVGEADRPPLPVPDGCLEHMVGSHVAGAAVAALLDGTREVEVSGVDVVAWSVATNANLYLPYGSDWFRAGRRANGSGGGYPYSVFDVADGQFCLIARTAKDWETLMRAAGSPPWSALPRYRDLRAMGKDYPHEVDDQLAPWLRSLTRGDLVALASEHGFPGGPIRRPDEVLDNPAVEHRWRTAEDGQRLRVPSPPFDVATTAGERGAPPLTGTLVLDLSWVWSGPAVGVALADLGATVIKVESSTRPDNTRLRGQPSAMDFPADAPKLELTPYFHAVNRGKRSVGLNLRTEDGRRLLADLAGQADVIIENLSPGVMDRLGTAPQQVHERNPDCVYVSLRGYRDHPTTVGLRAYAPVLSGGAGIESLVAYEGEAPIGMMTYGLSDANAASQGLLLVLAGLYARRARSTGAAVTLSQLDAAVVANGLNLVRAQRNRLDPRLRPFEDDEPVVTFAELPSAPWTSPDLFTTVATPWLPSLSVSRLPWRRDGVLPPVTGPGPRLGADTDDELTGRLGVAPRRVAELREAGAVE
ncbi:MAG TPA: CoA transferase [Actinophytocola sp.]|nr:CoA transferase [Actinophytocola sp.]